MANIKIHLSEDLKELFTKMADSKAARLVLSAQTAGIDASNLDKDFACYIKISKEEKTQLSYNTISEVAKKLEVDVEKLLSGEVQIPTDDAFYTTIKRTKIRPGRIFTKIFSTSFLANNLANADVESFSNRYTAELNNQITFQLVTGEDIRKYYYKPSYSDKFGAGTLHGSCMNGERQQEFLDIYVKNSNVSLLVAFDINGKVAGRALVWSKVSIKKSGSANYIDDQIFMDRIYYTADWLVDKFKAYAIKSNWYHRKKQGYDEQLYIVNPTAAHTYEEATMKVSLENLRLKFFPYIDTFYVPCYGAGFLTNDNRIAEHAADSVYFRQTSGLTNKVYNFLDKQYVDKSRAVWIKNKLSYYLQENSVFSSKSDDYFLKNECLFSKLDNEFVTPDEEIDTCAVTNIKYKKSRMIMSEYHNGMIHKKEAVETKDKGNLHKTMAIWSKTMKCWLSQKGAIKVEAIDDYIPLDIISKFPEKQFIEFLSAMNQYMPKEEEKKKDLIDVEGYVYEF